MKKLFSVVLCCGFLATLLLPLFLTEGARAEGFEDWTRKAKSWLAPAVKSPGKTVETADYILYIPSKAEKGRKYPLVIALSPSADAPSAVAVWAEAAEKYQWFVFASKIFSNDRPDMEKTVAEIASAVEELFPQYPIDPSRIVASGLSGGAMGSHALAFHRPDLIRAVVVNTGMMHERYLERGGEYPQGRLAVFLASPADFRYQQMQRDKQFLETLQWKTKWIEFAGGHRYAPPSAYDEAAAWLTVRFNAW